MRKLIFGLLLFNIVTINAFAQAPEQDCFYAKRILCTALYNESIAYTGNGNNQDEIAFSTAMQAGGNSCLPSKTAIGGGSTAEQNSVWYYFIPETTGKLNFTIDPAGSEDYDFALFCLNQSPNFNANNYILNSCQDIFSNNTAMMVACNSESGGGVNSGISTTLRNGNANLQYVNDVTVTVGQIYVLCVNRFGGTGGFNIDFSASDPIFDTKPPVVKPVSLVNKHALCLDQKDSSYFNEPILCSSVVASDFEVRDSSGNLFGMTVSAVDAGCTGNGFTANDKIVYTFNQNFPHEGLYYVIVKTGSDNNTISDQCGYFMAAGDTVSVIDVACSNFTFTPNPACTGGPVAFRDASRAPAGYYVLWDFGTGNPADTSNQRNPTFNYPAAGTYTIGYQIRKTYPDFANASGTSRTITVADCAAPTADFTISNLNPCPGDTVVLTDASNNGPSAWLWGTTGGTLTSTTTQNTKIVFSSPGTYTIGLMASNSNGSGSVAKQITAIDCSVPSASFAVSSPTSCDSAAFVFANTSTGSDSSITYAWSMPMGMPSSLTTKDAGTVYSNPGSYAVTLTVTNAFGSNAVTMPVKLDSCGGSVKFPTGLSYTISTTNGTSPIFRVYTTSVLENYTLNVFDRWGGLVFESTDYTETWDGTNQGLQLKPGLYVIYATYNLSSDSTKTKQTYTGTLSIY